jgi:predicted Zn-dependent protease with MMP-like domain
VTRIAFRELVEEAIDSIPPRFARHVRNLVVVIEDEPTPEVLADLEMEPDDSLLGLYQGTPLPDRSWGFGNNLPDKITLYQRIIEEEAGDDFDEVVATIGETLIHELGHYFGMSEDEIMDIEDRYWRGEAFADEPDDDPTP